ncbi:MAG: hypothetical protein EBZ34_04110, partial [Flavobacteriia bacterium]|nr:hypothetical protein [Flavobacteriia bacterium]
NTTVGVTMRRPVQSDELRKIGNRKETEASGGITEVNLRAYADSGVTYISLGALTHSVKSLDIHFKVKSL